MSAKRGPSPFSGAASPRAAKLVKREPSYRNTSQPSSRNASVPVSQRRAYERTLLQSSVTATNLITAADLPPTELESTLSVASRIKQLDFEDVASFFDHENPSLRAAAVRRAADILVQDDALTSERALGLIPLPLLLQDQDSRVRKSALHYCQHWLRRHPEPPLVAPLVALIQGLLDDKVAAVRRLAVLCTGIVAELFPTLDNCQHDAIFVLVCNRVTDIATAVRVQAFEVLAELTGASIELLRQGFDKKLMSHFKLRDSAHTKLRKQHGLASTTPQGDLTIDDVAIMSAGACGAFIHGLEDEMSGVRVAAVVAVEKHCVQASALSELALDFLVDMFNDEADRVRLQAIYSLSRLAAHFTLAEAQLDVMLSILEDGSATVRHAALAMLSRATIANYICLHVVVAAVLACLQRYPLDRHAAWRCLADLGRRHSHLAEFLVTRTLALSPHFDSVPPSPSDTNYISMMVFLCAAMELNTAIGKLVPKYFGDHHRYLAVEYPDYVKLHGSTADKFTDTLDMAASAFDWHAFLTCWQAARASMQRNNQKNALQSLHACLNLLEDAPDADGLKLIAQWACAWATNPLSQDCATLVRQLLSALPGLQQHRELLAWLRMLLASVHNSSLDDDYVETLIEPHVPPEVLHACKLSGPDATSFRFCLAATRRLLPPLNSAMFALRQSTPTFAISETDIKHRAGLPTKITALLSSSVSVERRVMLKVRFPDKVAASRHLVLGHGETFVELPVCLDARTKRGVEVDVQLALLPWDGLEIMSEWCDDGYVADSKTLRVNTK
eukprot:TRINITY_DN9727_c0_g1_i2.p1 TRINITY_DN9727_c0_g1~~TRINITY_DN9727_c0_g1_i2.p1  ORF type:complete len:787 (+),score=151.34 TRINITY_DN9727_c0_g1_i2:185-2545(+)